MHAYKDAHWSSQQLRLAPERGRKARNLSHVYPAQGKKELSARNAPKTCSNANRLREDLLLWVNRKQLNVQAMLHERNQ